MATTILACAHLDQYGPQSGGWGSPDQLAKMKALNGAQRVIFCESERDRDYPTSVEQHLLEADHLLTELIPPHMPQSWTLGKHFHFVVEGAESFTTVKEGNRFFDEFHARGVRGFIPIYHPSNPLGGCSKEPGLGLNWLGKWAISEAWRRGWSVDLAHMSHKSMQKALEFHRRFYPKEKVCYTHGGIWHDQIDDPMGALTNGNQERCLSWEIAERLINQGGLVCLSPCNPFYPDMELFIQHIVRLGELSNWKLIGVGTDYGGILDEWRFDGCNSIGDCMRTVHEALSAVHQNTEEVNAATGGNVLRFFGLNG